MKKEYFINHPDFLVNYLYNKLSRQSKNQFYLNFTDISYDLSGYIEDHYNNYIMSNKINRYDIYVSPETISHLNSLSRDYIKIYKWLKRDDLISKLKEECKKYNATYVLTPAKRAYFSNKGLSDTVIDRINNSYKEWKYIRGYKTFIDAENANVHKYLSDMTHTNCIIATSFNDIEYEINPKKKKNYISFRATNQLTATKNDLEPKYENEWISKKEQDFRQLRSEFLANYPDYVDLGDMSSNFPNLINCIRTGKYTDEDFHSKVAEEYGISRSVAKMAAVRCCFNSHKRDILYGLLDGADLDKLETELSYMEYSGLFYINRKKKNIMIAKGHTIEECYEFFSNNTSNKFFKWCNDFLTSWDACHNIYSNDYCPSLLAEFSSAIEMNVIAEAAEKGIKIINAYDHAYCLNGINYDWKGKYKEWAERLLPGLLEAMKKDQLNYKVKKEKISANVITKLGKKNALGKKNSLGKKNAAKNEVREFIRTHNYDINLAQKQFGWDKNVKSYWNRLIKNGKI